MIEATSSCPGCGLVLPVSDGPIHPYLGASPACWDLYGKVLAHEHGALDYPAEHRTCVDAYAVQHPGVPERRSIQSVAVHLMGLCLVLDRDLDPGRVAEVLARRDKRLADLRWLEPPKPNGTLTVDDVTGPGGADEHLGRVMRWAEDVWRAWDFHHDTVRAWLDQSLPD